MEDMKMVNDSTAAHAARALKAHLADLLRRYDVNDYAASVRVFAVKAQ